jgi:hypothetical protein
MNHSDTDSLCVCVCVCVYVCVYIQSRNQTVGVLIRSTNRELLYIIRICHRSEGTALMWKFLFKYCQVCQCFVMTTQKRGGEVGLALLSN